MAIGVTSGVSTTSTSNTTSYASASFTPAANDLLIVFIVAGASSGAVGTLTDSQGIGFTSIARQIFNTSDVVQCFIANKLATNSAMTVTFDCTGDAANGCAIYVARITGAEGVYYRQVNTASGAAATTPAVAMNTAFLTGNGGLACCGNGANPAALTPPGSWTETNGVDTGYNTPATGQECPNRTSGETGSTITWGASSGTAWGAIVLELFVAGTGPVPQENMMMSGFFGGISSI